METQFESARSTEARGLCVAADHEPVAEITIRILPHWAQGTDVERAGWAKIFAGQLVAHLDERLGDLRFSLPPDSGSGMPGGLLTVATARLRLAAGCRPDRYAIYKPLARLIAALTTSVPEDDAGPARV